MGSIPFMMYLSYSALATPVRTEIPIQMKPVLRTWAEASLRLVKPSIYRAPSTMAIPSHCIQLSLSPKRIIENSTTNTGREPLMVLTVVRGRRLRPSMPDTQEAVTKTALRASLR